MGKEIQRESRYIHVCEENGFSNNVMYSFIPWVKTAMAQKGLSL